jgi:MFS family permease
LIVSNIGTWMHDVGAAWLMTSLAPSPFMVALVQAAGTLPAVVLALPAGALADILDRRRYLIAVQLWMVCWVLILAYSAYHANTSAEGLLAITFALGIGTAMAMPAWASITPELVPTEQLRPAITLNGLGVNVSRAIGPALGGAIIALSGPAMVFILNAISFLGVLTVLLVWRRPSNPRPLPAERFFGAMRAGLRYIRHAGPLHSVLVRAGAFFTFASALWALLPLLVRTLLHAGPAVYGVMLALIGLGAVLMALCLPRLRGHVSGDQLVVGASVIYACNLMTLAHIDNIYFIALQMGLTGSAWIAVVSTLQVSAQAALPEWVRARGLALFIVVFMSGMAGGSLLWGQIANLTSIPAALTAAGAGMLLAVFSSWNYRLGHTEELDLVPSQHWPTPAVATPLSHNQGPVLVQLIYQVAPERRHDFMRLMPSCRRMRLRDGAYLWRLYRDTAALDRYTEYFVVESWLEHLRQHHRVTADDKRLQQQIAECLLANTRPEITHNLAVDITQPPS